MFDEMHLPPHPRHPPEYPRCADDDNVARTKPRCHEAATAAERERRINQNSAVKVLWYRFQPWQSGLIALGQEPCMQREIDSGGRGRWGKTMPSRTILHRRKAR